MIDSKSEGKSETFRTPNRFWQWVIVVFTFVGLILSINQIFILRLFGPIEFLSAYLYALFACFLSIVFIIFPANKGVSRSEVPLYDTLLFA